VISDKEKLMTVYHEAGHTLVGMNLPHTDPIHKVSIMPRGGALGVTQTLPNEDMLSLTNDRAENFIAFLMGGRCAEEIVYGQMTSGASNDIERATSLARSMVCKWGMSEKMGPINYHKSGVSAFTGAGENVDYSEKTAQEIDEEINRIVEKNYRQAINILKSNRDGLDRLAHALMAWETIDFQQVKDVVAGIDIGVPLKSEKKSNSNDADPKVPTKGLDPVLA
jgi:cell division protease FtsH